MTTLVGAATAARTKIETSVVHDRSTCFSSGAFAVNPNFQEATSLTVNFDVTRTIASKLVSSAVFHSCATRERPTRLQDAYEKKRGNKREKKTGDKFFYLRQAPPFSISEPFDHQPFEICFNRFAINFRTSRGADTESLSLVERDNFPRDPRYLCYREKKFSLNMQKVVRQIRETSTFYLVRETLARHRVGETFPTFAADDGDLSGKSRTRRSARKVPRIAREGRTNGRYRVAADPNDAAQRKPTESACNNGKGTIYHPSFSTEPTNQPPTHPYERSAAVCNKISAGTMRTRLRPRK